MDKLPEQVRPGIVLGTRKAAAGTDFAAPSEGCVMEFTYLFSARFANPKEFQTQFPRPPDACPPRDSFPPRIMMFQAQEFPDKKNSRGGKRTPFSKIRFSESMLSIYFQIIFTVLLRDVEIKYLSLFK